MTANEIHPIPASGVRQSSISDRWATVVLAIFCGLLFTLASYEVGIVHKQDILAHLSWAQQLAEQGVTYLPHFTYQQLVVIVRALLPFSAADLVQKGLAAWLAIRSYKIAGLLVIALFYGLTAILIQRKLLGTLRSVHARSAELLSILLTLALMLVAPINLFTISQHRLYLGYIGINVFHNPTVIMLKPMALFIFWLLLDWSTAGTKPINVVGLAALTAYATFTKPNFTICYLPVVALWIIYRWWRKLPFKLNPPLLGFILPAVLILGYQYWFAYLGSGTTSIVFAPLLEMKFYAPTGLSWMFILSFLFPLSVLVLQFRKATQDQGLILAWGIFLVGAAMTYLLAEQGGREYNLNFEWGAQVGLFILFIQTVLFLIKNWNAARTEDTQAFALGYKITFSVILGLHLLSGVIWYLAEVFQPLQWWR